MIKLTGQLTHVPNEDIMHNIRWHLKEIRMREWIINKAAIQLICCAFAVVVFFFTLAMNYRLSQVPWPPIFNRSKLYNADNEHKAIHFIRARGSSFQLQPFVSTRLINLDLPCMLCRQWKTGYNPCHCVICWSAGQLFFCRSPISPLQAIILIRK